MTNPVQGTEWCTGIEYNHMDWARLFAICPPMFRLTHPKASYTCVEILKGALYRTPDGIQAGGQLVVLCKLYWN